MAKYTRIEYRELKNGTYKLHPSTPFRWQCRGSLKGFDIKLDDQRLTPDGILTAKWPFVWDGATGALDTDDIMDGSCGHDILCNFIKAGLIPERKWNACAKEFRRINKAAGMPFVRRWETWAGVRVYGRVR